MHVKLYLRSVKTKDSCLLRDRIWPWTSKKGQERFFAVLHPQTSFTALETYHRDGIYFVRVDPGHPGKLDGILKAQFKQPGFLEQVLASVVPATDGMRFVYHNSAKQCH